jgi:hypothetical protein
MFIFHAEREDKKLMVLAVVAWAVRRSAHVISLILIFNVGMKDGLLHAVYSEYHISLDYLSDSLRTIHGYHYAMLL